MYVRKASRPLEQSPKPCMLWVELHMAEVKRSNFGVNVNYNFMYIRVGRVSFKRGQGGAPLKNFLPPPPPM